MKLFHASVILFFFSSCSFDTKSGIWKNENIPDNSIENIVFKDFQKITSSKKNFNQKISINQSFNFNINKPIQNNNWEDIFFSKNNNSLNFQYNGENKIIFKSKKLTKYTTGDYILFKNNNLFLTDEDGNIISFSINNSEIKKFNFYKKKYKKIKKILNFIIENNVIYVSDNIGYIYAYNYNENKIIWAKKYKIPFRSNIKLFSDKIVTSNQNNDFYVFEKKSGNLVKLIPSEETIINNSFINNISLSDDKIFFLNTYGSLYSIDQNSLKSDWFINFNKFSDLSLSSLFYGSNVINFKNKILLSSNQNFYFIDAVNGAVISKKKFSSFFKPIAVNEYVFLITKNNYLISMKLRNGDIIYSYDITQKVANYLNTNKKDLVIKVFMMVNNKLLIFLKNSFVVKFDIRGEIEEVFKLPSSLKTRPIIVNNSLMYLNKKNRFLIRN